MITARDRRLLIVVGSFIIGGWIEHLLFDQEFAGIFSLILLPFFVAPIMLPLIYLDQKATGQIAKGKPTSKLTIVLLVLVLLLIFALLTTG